MLKKMQIKKEVNDNLRIRIPEGCFAGNCYDCRYADWSDRKDDGRIYCRGSYGGYNHPKDRNGCFYFKE